MHSGPPILVIPNAWDVASARALAAVPGCRAIATTSAAVAQSLGWEDGERAPGDEMLQAAGRMAAAVELPMNVMLRAGMPDPATLRGLGVARVTWGAGLAAAAYAEAVRIVSETLRT